MRRIDAESETLITHALRAEGHDASEDGTGRGTPLVPWLPQGYRIQDSKGTSETISAVAFQEAQTGVREYESAGTQRAGGPGHDPVGTRVRAGMAVRRLTPMECERLQGFSDGYTAVPYRGKTAADGPRYKSLGNSMCVNVMSWIGKRIQAAEEHSTGGTTES